MAEGSVGDDKPILPYKSDAWHALKNIVDDESLLKEMSFFADYL
jgi:hypothetical protein